jgi:hypothetical protein
MIEEKAISDTSNAYSAASVSIQEEEPSKSIAKMAVTGLAIVFLISIFYEPSRPGPDGFYFTICAFKLFTNLPCPGCGLTHSFCSIGKGDFEDAFAYNLLGPPVFLLAILIFLRAVFVLAGWTKPALLFDRTASRMKLLHILFAAFVIFGFGRIIYLAFFRP